ncbi:hypothetical protein FJ250_03795, partial [bacterium]|nr:hypothetical protein [bacterium]
MRSAVGRVLTTRRKLMLLTGVVSLALLGGNLGLQALDRRQTSLLMQQAGAETVAAMDRYLTLDGALLATFAADYTYWDDMVAFAAAPDSTWAADNLIVSMGTFGASAAWVFNQDREEVYRCFADGHAEPGAFPVPLAAWADSLAANRFLHFFTDSPAGLLEVRGAVIVPFLDVERTGPQFGCLLVARVWDEPRLRRLASDLGCSVELAPVPPGGIPAPS